MNPDCRLYLRGARFGVEIMEFETAVAEISATELKKRLDTGEDIVLLDVREPHELAICKLASAVHIPLGSLLDRLDEMKSCQEKEIVVFCRSGKRSERAAQFMQEKGYRKVKNLAGGILAWAKDVDPKMSRY